MSYDLTKYAANAMFGFASIMAYDIAQEGVKINGYFSYSDASIFALSTLVSNYANDLSNQYLPFFKMGYLPGLIYKPLLTALIYSYFYDKVLSRRYPGMRDFEEALKLASVLDVFITYTEGPFLALFGISIDGY